MEDAIEIVEEIIEKVTEDEHINCDLLSEVMCNLSAVMKTAKEDFEDAKKEKLAKQNKILAEENKEWFNKLPIGAPLKYKTADGKVHDCTKGEVKPKYVRAHVKLLEIPAGGTKVDRMIPYENLIKGDNKW